MILVKQLLLVIQNSVIYINIKKIVDFCKQYNIGIAGAVSVD